MGEPPALSDEARRAALAKAAEVRRVRADLRTRLKSGELTMAGLLDLAARDEVVGGMKALAALESLPGVGKVGARRAMAAIGIAESRRLRGLGDQQRARLLTEFG